MEPQFELDDAHASYASACRAACASALSVQVAAMWQNADVQGLRPGQLKADLELNK